MQGVPAEAKNMKSIILFLIVTMFAGFSTSLGKVSTNETNTFARCAVPTFAAQFRGSNAVFAGKVVSERKEGDEKIFTFAVERYWKGGKSKTLEVRHYETMRYQAWLKVGEKYLVYAHKDENGNLFDSRCSLTKSYSQAKADLKLLGKGKTTK